MIKEPEYIYFKLTNGGIVDNDDIIKAAKIVHGKEISSDDFESVRNYADYCLGVEEELVNPSVRDLLEHGERVKAIHKYRREHNTTLVEAKAIIYQLETELKNNTKE